MIVVDTFKAARNIKAKPIGQTEQGEAAYQRLMHGFCAQCAHHVSVVDDAASEREFYISGMCQNCQDSFFGA